jgi:hypothetical protein
MLGLNHLISPSLNRRYLLEHTQHPIAGGFGKVPGDPPGMIIPPLRISVCAVLALLTLSVEQMCCIRTSDLRRWR